MKYSSLKPDPGCDSGSFFNYKKKINLHEFYGEMCTNFPLKKPPNLKRWSPIIHHLFPNSCYSKRTHYYLPKMHNLPRVQAVAPGYTCQFSWYMAYHIKECTVEVIKQNLHQWTIPTSWIILFCFKPLTNLGSYNQKKKELKSVHKMSSPATMPKSTAWVKP